MALPPCPKSERPGCPFQISFVQHARVIATGQVEWARAVEPFVLQEAAELPAAADPLDAKPIAGWSTGDEDSEASTAARVVKLAPGVVGLLVVQQAGFEHLKRAHFLFAHVGKQLQQVWSSEEDSGPTWSATMSLPYDAKHEAVLLVDGLSYDESTEPDELEADLVHWDDATSSVKVEPAGAHARVVVVGPFGTLAAAKRARSTDCLAAYWLLPTARFAGFADGKRFVLALIGASEAGANQTLQRTLACKKGLHGKVTTFAVPDAPDEAAASTPAIVGAALRATVPGQANSYFELRPQVCSHSKDSGCPFDVSFSTAGKVRATRSFAWLPAVEPWKMAPDLWRTAAETRVAR